MKRLNFEELLLLPTGTKVNHITRGEIHFWVVIGSVYGRLYLYSDSNVERVKMLSKYSHISDGDFYTTDYNPIEAGAIMIQQIEDWSKKEIENIQAVYTT